MQYRLTVEEAAALAAAAIITTAAGVSSNINRAAAAACVNGSTNCERTGLLCRRMLLSVVGRTRASTFYCFARYAATTNATYHSKGRRRSQFWCYQGTNCVTYHKISKILLAAGMLALV